MKVLENKKTGISLVALIVTIIVLIILTGAVIVTFMEDGIVDRAKYAVRKSDLATLQESYMIEYNKKKIDVDTGTTEGIDKIEILEKAVKNVKLDKDFKFTTYAGNKSVTYIGDNDEIREWVNGIIIESTEGYILANGYLTNLSSSGTTVVEIKAQLGDDITIKNYNGTALEDNDKVWTGATIEKDGEVIATVIVYGECNGNTLNTADDAYLKDVLKGYNAYRELVLLAGDVNGDGYVSGEDGDYIIDYYCGVKPINQKRIYDKEPILYSKVVYYEDEEDGEIYSYIDIYIYTWYKENADFEELINNDGEYGAQAKAFGINLTIPSGITYLQIENKFKDIISNEVQITDIEDKTIVAEVGGDFHISIPEIIDENTRSKIESLRIKIKAIN